MESKFSNISQEKRDVLEKMKVITDANDEICVAILEAHEYNLDASIDEFFSRSW